MTRDGLLSLAGRLDALAGNCTGYESSIGEASEVLRELATPAQELREIIAHPFFALARGFGWDDAQLVVANQLIDITVIRLTEIQSTAEAAPRPVAAGSHDHNVTGPLRRQATPESRQNPITTTELLSDMSRLRAALADIAEPMVEIERSAKATDSVVNGHYAMLLCKDANWLRDKARKALEQTETPR